MKRTVGIVAGLALLLAGCSNSGSAGPVGALGAGASTAVPSTGINAPGVVACAGLSGAWGGFMQNPAVEAMTKDPLSADWDAVNVVSKRVLKSGDELRPKLTDPAVKGLWTAWNASGVAFTVGLDYGDTKTLAMQKVLEFMKSGDAATAGCSDLMDRATS